MSTHCLNEKQIGWKAQGDILWNYVELHIDECKDCQAKIETAKSELKPRKEYRRPAGLSPDKKKVNKMGTSHPSYIKAITS